MPVVHAYRRVSDEKQVNGYSLQAQDAQIDKYAAYKFPDCRVIRYCDPAVSAVIPWFERPAGSQLWANLSVGDHIVVAMFDRAFRSVRDICNAIDSFEERSVYLHCLDFGIDTSTAIGQMLNKILASVKEYERKALSERIKAVNRWKRENGIPLHFERPHGYKMLGDGRHRKFGPWQEERELGRYLASLHDQGLSYDSTYLRFSAEMRKGTLPCPWNKLISRDTVVRLIDATRKNFPLPDGKYIPSTAQEFLEYQAKESQRCALALQECAPG